MMTTKRKLFGLLMSTALALSLAAPGKVEAQDAKAPTEVTVWLLSWWEKDRERIMKEFAEANPGYTAKIELMPINKYTENVATAAMGGNPPDVVTLDILFIPTLASCNLLMPLDDFMGKNGLTSDLYTKSVYDAGVIGGKTYAIPYRICPASLFYNKTMFDAAGVPYPKDDIDFDEFLEIAKKLTVPGKQYGYGIAAAKSDPANVMSSFSPVLFGMGGDILNEDMTKAVLDTPEAIAAIKWWTELYTKHKVVPEGTINYSNTRDLTPMAMNQQIAMIYMADAALKQVQPYADQNKFEWGYTKLPGLPRACGWSASIPSTTKNVEGAETFIKWFTDAEVVGRQSLETPGVLAAQKKGVWAEPFWQDYYKIADATKPIPVTPHWTAIQTVIIDELHNVLLETATPEEAAKSMTDKVNEILQQ